MATTAAKKSLSVVVTGDTSGSSVTLSTAIGSSNLPIVVQTILWEIPAGTAAGDYVATFDVNGDTDTLILNVDKATDIAASRQINFGIQGQLWSDATIEVTVGKITLLLA